MAEQAGTDWRRKLRQVGFVRLVATVLFLATGVFVARYGWEVPLIGDAERALYDTRFKATAEVVAEPSDRITLVVYNDATLEGLRKRSPLDRRMLARALSALNRMQPQAIGIDILIDQAQDEDEELIQAFRAMRVPTWLAFATHRFNPAQIEPWQEEFQRELFRRIGPGEVRPASIRLETDRADGVIRRWALTPAGLPPALANAMTAENPAFRDYAGSINFRLPAEGGRFPKISIEELAAIEELPAEVRPIVEAAFRDRIQGRYVLIGGDINDLDDFETPMTRFGMGWTKGLEVHAQMLDQQLDGRMPAPLPGWLLWALAFLTVTVGALTSLIERGWRLGLILVVQLGIIAGLPFLLQEVNSETLGLPAFGWGVGWLLAFLGVGAAARAVGSEQRQFAQSALGKYLPPDVARQIMRDPERLALTGERTSIHALFTDLEDFTKLSHAITPEQLSGLLNRYLDMMSDIVLKHGGTIDKFVGDAVVAFWGAPIARPDDADRAARAAIEMSEGGREFAATAGDDVPPIGITRVGLHRGEAVVGNFGGKGRIQYTALGDAMNTAARLESANKQLKTTALVSSEAKDATTLDAFRPMGRIVLSGRATPVEVWEPVPAMDTALRRELTDLWRRFDGGEAETIVQLQAIADSHKPDEALQLFVYRIREAGPGGHYVLGSK